MNLRKNFGKLFAVQLHVLLTLFSIFSLCGCGVEGTSSSTSPKSPKSPRGIVVNVDRENQMESLPFKNTIVLLHGLNCPEDLKDVESKLKADLPVSDFEIMRISRYNSSTVPTTQQADDVYRAILAGFKTKELNQHSPIILIGDSHGGLVAAEIYRLHKHDLNVIGIVGNHTPWEGAPGIRPSDEAIRNLETTIKMIGMFAPQLLGGMDLNQLSFKNLLTEYLGSSAGNDLDPTGTFINSIKSTLANIEIPVLAIGGTIEPIAGLLELISFFFQGAPGININSNLIMQNINQFSAGNPLIAGFIQGLGQQFIAVIGDAQNDAFLPLSSQIVRNVGNSNIQQLTVPGYHHFYGITQQGKVYGKLLLFIAESFENAVNKQ
jgi:hypothetical protein